MSFSVQPLNVFTLDHFRGLFPESMANSALMFGASDEEGPTGIALGNISGTLLDAAWIYVERSKRRRGIGRALLGALEEEARARGAKEAALVYAVRESEPLLHLLASEGWRSGLAPAVRSKISTRIREAPWFQRAARTKGAEIIPWSTVTDAERARLEGVPALFEPAFAERGADPHTSFALRKNGALAGWLFTHLLDPKTLSYTLLFVREDLRGSGIAFAMVACAVEKMVELYGADSVGSVFVMRANMEMSKVIDGALSRFVVSSIELDRAGKTLA